MTMRAGVVLWLAGLCLCSGCASGPAREYESGLGKLDFRKVVRGAKDRVFPALVFIKALKESHRSGEKLTQEIHGSGVIMSADGEFLTNWHVVDKASDVRCLLLDGRAFNARVIGTDKDTDLALVKLEVPEGAKVPFASLGDSSGLKEGDFVMAMGAPWGLTRSVSIGIISCSRRLLPEHGEYNLWLQTDASISPGNSGGPLVNTSGEVIGINTLAIHGGGTIGFAIPSNTVAQVVAQLRAHGRMAWSWTGLHLQPLRDFSRNIYFDAPAGVIVAGTEQESPARRAGIQPKDRIITINGLPVTAVTEEDLPAVRRAIGLLEKFRPAVLEVVRGDKTLRVEITPREKGKVEGEELDCPRWDLTVKAINQFDNPELHLYRKEGVFIYGVKYPGNATEAELQPQDIVVKIGSKEVKSLEDVAAIHREALRNINASHRVVFTVLRNGLTRQFVLDFSRDYDRE